MVFPLQHLLSKVGPSAFGLFNAVKLLGVVNVLWVELGAFQLNRLTQSRRVTLITQYRLQILETANA